MKKIKLRKFSDERGSLVENTLAQIMLDSKHFFISKSKPGVVRGNHYHKKKSEWFYLIQGTVSLHIENVKTKKRTVAVVRENDHQMINILPWHAHAIKNIGKKELILLALVNEVLDHSRPDTYDYKLV